MYRMERHRPQHPHKQLGRKRKPYKSFAHEIASLNKKMQKQAIETGSVASGTICICGLECRVCQDERTSCERCQQPYCSVECLRWDWEKGGHREECPGCPPRRPLKMLDFQTSDSSSIGTGTTNKSAGEASQESQRKPSLPFHELQQKIYDALAGKEPVGVHREGDKLGPSRANQQPEQPPMDPPMEQRVDPPTVSGGSDGTSGSQSQYTEVSASASGTLESSEYTEVTAESSDDRHAQNQADNEGFEDDGLFYQPTDQFLDDIPEEDTDEAGSSSVDNETLEINRFGSLIAGNFREESGTPDTPGGETPITSNNSTRLQRRRWRDFERYEMAEQGQGHSDDYRMEEQMTESPSTNNHGVVVIPSLVRKSSSDFSEEPERFEEEEVPGQVEVLGHRKGRYHSIPGDVTLQKKQQRDERPEKPAHPLTKEQRRVRQTRDSSRSRQRYFDYSRQPNSPMYPSGEESVQMYPPVAHIDTSESKLIDQEAPSSDSPGNGGGYEFSSATLIKRRRQKRIIRCCAVSVSFMIGIMIVVGVATGILWFKPDLIKFNSINSKDEDLDTASPTPAPAPTTSPAPTLPYSAAEPFEMVLERQFQSTADGYGASVAIAGDILAIASPIGEIETYVRVGNQWSFEELLASGPESGFGADISMSSDGNGVAHLVVGAPDTNQVSLFAYSPLSGSWAEVGSPLSPEIVSRRLLDEPSEGFGTSVSISDNGRVVVGAPANGSNGVNAGMTYIFHFTAAVSALSSAPEFTFTIPGKVANSGSGSSVDISRDGKSVAVGEPGEKALRIFDWDGDDWIETFHLHYPQEFDLGSSVAFLSNDYVAVGSPSAQNSKGIVHICKRTRGGWVELKSVVGDFGDRLGSFGAIGGLGDPNGPELVVTTAGGSVRRYDFDGNDWITIFNIDEGVAASSVALSKTEDSYELVVGFASLDSAALYLPAVSNTTPSPQTETFPQPTAAPSTQTSPTSPNQSTTSRPTPSPQQTTTTLSPSSSSPADSPPSSTEPPTKTPTTPAPTNPTETPGTEWSLSPGSPFFGTVVNSNFGSSVAVAGDFVVAGEEGAAEGVGQILTYGKNSAWTALDTVSELDTLKFGSAVDLVSVNGVGRVLVGAKETKDENELARFGSASCFEFDGDGVSQVGSIIRPPFNLVESGGEFGSSVAMATDIQRIAVGAPESNLDGANLDTGRIYTYDFDGSEWQQMTDPLIGSAGNKLGSSMDMSKDGSHLLAGAPEGRSGDGLVYYYKWDAGAEEWDEVLPIFGSDSEALGSSVAIISDDGSQVAFGGPNYGNNQGIVRVYANFGGLFAQLGSDIVGSTNERIGTTLSGAQGRIALGTDNGSFRVYEYNGSWTQIATGPNLESAVVSIDMDEDGNRVVVGLASEETLVFELA
mmetsp:Transcript_15941/g.34962  ORF Transcript_15941/g.34962 Transcript_15941/m.34962 type:complete len:1388 (+) Transcript_15941:63-4226(+)